MGGGGGGAMKCYVEEKKMRNKKIKGNKRITRSKTSNRKEFPLCVLNMG
jgi:hypothetical protein